MRRFTIRRRSDSKKLRFLKDIKSDASKNIEAFIQLGKNVNPYGQPWEAPEWNVTGFFSQKEGRRQKLTICFSRWILRAKVDSNAIGSSAVFAVKAAGCLLQARYNMGASQCEHFFRMSSLLVRHLADVHYDIGKTQRRHFDATVKYIMSDENGYSHNTVYTMCSVLQRFAEILDSNGLTRATLRWSHGISSLKPEAVQEVLEPTVDSKKKVRFANEEVIFGIGQLYQCIPKSNWPDRLRICLVTLIVIFGLRISEAINSPALPLEHDEDGVLWYRYYRQKRRSAGNSPTRLHESDNEQSYIGLDRKVVPTVWKDIAADVVNELLELTKSQRLVASWIENNDWKPHLPENLPSHIDMRELEALFSMQPSTGPQFCTTRNIPRSPGPRRCHVIATADLRTALKLEVDRHPALRVGKTRQKIPLSQIVGIAFPSGLRPNVRAYLQYAVTKVTDDQVRAFLAGKNDTPSAFVRYGILGRGGQELVSHPHSIRRFVNNALDQGGLNELAQAEWFGRTVSQNEAYQALTPYERAKVVRPILLSDRFRGRLRDSLRRVPVDRASAYLAHRVRSVHETPVGLCAHDYTQVPCELHRDCKDSCGDLLLDGQHDEKRKEFFKSQIPVLENEIEKARQAIADGNTEADAALAHHIEKLRTYKNGLQLMEEYANEEDSCQP